MISLRFCKRNKATCTATKDGNRAKLRPTVSMSQSEPPLAQPHGSAICNSYRLWRSAETRGRLAVWLPDAAAETNENLTSSKATSMLWRLWGLQTASLAGLSLSEPPSVSASELEMSKHCVPNGSSEVSSPELPLSLRLRRSSSSLLSASTSLRRRSHALSSSALLRLSASKLRSIAARRRRGVCADKLDDVGPLASPCGSPKKSLRGSGSTKKSSKD